MARLVRCGALSAAAFLVFSCISARAWADTSRVQELSAFAVNTWQAPAGGAASYLIAVGNAPGTSNLLLSDVGPMTTVSASGPPGTYYVRILARNACGSSVGSNEVVVTIP